MCGTRFLLISPSWPFLPERSRPAPDSSVLESRNLPSGGLRFVIASSPPSDTLSPAGGMPRTPPSSFCLTRRLSPLAASPSVSAAISPLTSTSSTPSTAFSLPLRVDPAPSPKAGVVDRLTGFDGELGPIDTSAKLVRLEDDEVDGAATALRGADEERERRVCDRSGRPESVLCTWASTDTTESCEVVRCGDAGSGTCSRLRMGEWFGPVVFGLILRLRLWTWKT